MRASTCRSSSLLRRYVLVLCRLAFLVRHAVAGVVGLHIGAVGLSTLLVVLTCLRAMVFFSVLVVIAAYLCCVGLTGAACAHPKHQE